MHVQSSPYIAIQCIYSPNCRINSKSESMPPEYREAFAAEERLSATTGTPLACRMLAYWRVEEIWNLLHLVGQLTLGCFFAPLYTDTMDISGSFGSSHQIYSVTSIPGSCI